MSCKTKNINSQLFVYTDSINLFEFTQDSLNIQINISAVFPSSHEKKKNVKKEWKTIRTLV